MEKLSRRLTLLLQRYIHFSFKSTVCLSKSWRMKCMHENDVHEHKDVDDFLIFEHVCVINLKGWLLCCKHACNAILTWEKLIWSPRWRCWWSVSSLKKNCRILFLHAWLEGSIVLKACFVGLLSSQSFVCKCKDMEVIHKMWRSVSFVEAGV